MNVTYKFILISLLAVFISSCKTSRMPGGEKQPEWVTARPIDNSYYIGIGKSSKGSQENYQQTAKEKALTDMASEISVTLSNHSLLRQFEDKQGFTEEFESLTRTSTENQLVGYSLVDQWESADHYWVYYRLSKSEYERQQREKLERAKNTAKDFYEKAISHQKQGEIHQALLNLTHAFTAIQPFLDKDLSIFTLEGRVFLGNAILQAFQSIMSDLELQPNQKLYKLKSLTTVAQPIGITVLYNGNRVTELPIRFYFTEMPQSPIEEVITNNAGIANTTIASSAPKGARQYLRAQVDIQSYFSNIPLLEKMFASQRQAPATDIAIEMQEQTAFIQSHELFLGKTDPKQPLAGILKEELTKNFFNFTEDRQEADVFIDISVHTTKGEDLGKHNLHTAYTSCSIRISQAANGEMVYEGGFSQIKGMKAGGFETAARDAIKKAGAIVRQEVVSEIRKVQLK